MELPLPLAYVHMHRTGNRLKCWKYFCCGLWKSPLYGEALEIPSISWSFGNTLYMVKPWKLLLYGEAREVTSIFCCLGTPLYSEALETACIWWILYIMKYWLYVYDNIIEIFCNMIDIYNFDQFNSQQYRNYLLEIVMDNGHQSSYCHIIKISYIRCSCDVVCHFVNIKYKEKQA